MRIFGIDPGSAKTGYGCIDTDGTHHRLVAFGALATPAGATLAERLLAIHDGLAELIGRLEPACVAIETLFHARNVQSALKLGHARGVALLAAVEQRRPVVEYTPGEIKRAVVGHGRADKGQIQHMVRVLLGLRAAPSPADAADALAVAICHAHRLGPVGRPRTLAPPPRLEERRSRTLPRSWRAYRPPR